MTETVERPVAAPSARLADARYHQVANMSKGVVSAVQTLWRDVSPDRILAALSGDTGKAILNAVISGQLTVAQGAASFVTSAMLLQGASQATEGSVVAGQLAGYAADGRALSSLLYVPGITTARALAMGAAPDVASLMGLSQMARLVATTLTDTARTATSVAMTATTSCVAYVRVVKLPACARCIVLSGRQYSYSEGFRRHPRCDCGMEPLSDREWRNVQTPRQMFDAMDPAQRRKAFGAAGVEAIDNGADINQIVNARRGMTTATAYGQTVKATREGTTKRGIGAKAMDSAFAKQPGSKYARTVAPRLLPEEILAQASDRAHQIRLLKRYGYIT